MCWIDERANKFASVYDPFMSSPYAVHTAERKLLAFLGVSSGDDRISLIDEKKKTNPLDNLLALQVQQQCEM